MNKTEFTKKALKFFTTLKQIIAVTVKNADKCYNKLPLDKINSFLADKKIRIDVKSRIFKYSLSGGIFLLLIIALLPGKSENIATASPTHERASAEFQQVSQAIPDKSTSSVQVVKKSSSGTTFIPAEKPSAAASTPKPTVKKETVEEAAKRLSTSSAIEESRCDVIKYLLDNKKININQVIIGGSADVARGMRPNHYLRADEPAPGDTMLMHAVRLKNYKVVEFLLEQGANVNALNQFNMSALHIAVQLNDINLCKMLLNNNTVINKKNILEETPLLTAVRNNSMPVIKLLLSGKASVPEKAGGKLLVELIERNNIEMAKILCENGADVSYEVEQTSYRTGSEIPVKAPITLAVKQNNPDLVKYLLEKGASATGKGGNYSGFCDFVHIYVASLNRPDILPLLSYNPRTTVRMLCYAAYYGHIDVMNFLLKQKHNINQIAFFDDGNGRTEISPLLFLVQRGSPLAMAIAGRQYDAAKLLLDNGADPKNIDIETYERRFRIAISNPTVSGSVLNDTDWLERDFDWVMKWRAGYCDTKFYELLAEYGRQPQGMDLFFAAAVENSSLMDQILKQGVKSPENVEDWVNYITAVRPPNALKILALLFDKSILSVNLQKSQFHHTLLTNAITCECKYFGEPPKIQVNKKDVVSFLLKYGANVNLYANDSNGEQSALYYAISQKKDDIIKTLLEYNAKMPHRDIDLLLSCAHGSLPEYKYLFSKGVKISIDPERSFASQRIVSAIANEPYVIAKLVIENCEDLNIVPKGEKITLLDCIESRVENKQIIKFMRGKGAKKYSELKQDPREQYKLAESYMQGSGVQKDLQMAVYWYRRSAELGYAEAQYKLAECYRQGKWVEKDVKQAEFWYRKAAEQKHAQAQLELNKWAALRERKSVVCGSVLLPCEGEPLDEYRERFHITSAEYEENTGAPLLDYYADGVKAIVIKRRKFQINNGQEPDGVEVKGKDGNVEIYAERTKSTP